MVATQAQLIQRYLAKRLTLDALLAQIGSAPNPSRSGPKPERNFLDTDSDPDPQRAETGSSEVFVAWSRGLITEAEFRAINDVIYSSAGNT